MAGGSGGSKRKRRLKWMVLATGGRLDTARARRLCNRGLRLRCPECGLGRIYRSPFRMKAQCEYCDLIYEREQGYFIGAIYLNVIGTESLLLGTLLIYGLITGKVNEPILTVLIGLALLLPLLFFHHSRSLWLSIDHTLNPRSGSGVRFCDSRGSTRESGVESESQNRTPDPRV